jgi:uncharacterized protein (DUF58 family)
VPPAGPRSPVRSSGPFQFLFEPRAAGLRRVLAWARARQGEDALPLTLSARRVYILPTRTGAAAAVALFLMLLAGLNYNNSLALLLCFLLSGVALVSMYECHRTLLGLQLHAAVAEPTFSGQLGELTLQLRNDDARARRALSIRCEPCAATTLTLEPGAMQRVRLNYRARGRGRQRIERLTLATETPLGLFRAWTWLHLPLDAVIYPAPSGTRPLPLARAQTTAGTHGSHESGDEEWAWLRPFRDGDSPRSVAWKAYAHGGPLLVAHYEAPADVHRLLDFMQLLDLPLERRLSQLAHWVLDCERLGDSYVLSLPGQRLPPRHGLAQRRAALEALALYGQ